MTSSARSALPLLASILAAFALALPARAGPVFERVKTTRTVRVCIRPGACGITDDRQPKTQQLGGIDIDLSTALAHDPGATLQCADSSFPVLADDLKNERCDVAMFAVGLLPQRMEQPRLSRPYLQSDIDAVATQGNRALRRRADIDPPGLLVAVQAGTFMQPLMTASPKQAKLVSVKPPATRERELEAGRVDVFMTDRPASRCLLDDADRAMPIAPPQPFHVLPYGCAVEPGDDAWLDAVDRFGQRIQQDGRLDAAARRHRLAAIVVR